VPETVDVDVGQKYRVDAGSGGDPTGVSFVQETPFGNAVKNVVD
jgi:hypothetical protein